MEKALVFEAWREEYEVNDRVVNSSYTVRDLIEFLEQFDGNTKVLLSHDNGYTYGHLGVNVDEYVKAPISGEYVKVEGWEVW